MATFYAVRSPRGFANERQVHSFPSRQARDAWVERINARQELAATMAEAVTATEARKIAGYRGDAATQSFNSVIRHDALGHPA